MKRYVIYGFVLLFCAVQTVSSQDEDSQWTLIHDDMERAYTLHIPAGYSEDAPAPLVVFLHGAGGTGDGMASASPFDQLADEMNVFVAYPDGVDGVWDYLDIPIDERPLIDDFGFITAMIDQLIEEYVIDESRIYGMGYSNGGLMATRLRCALDDRLAAVAVISATMTFGLSQLCLDADPLPYLLVIGTEDSSFPWEGRLEVDAGVMRGSFSVAQTFSFMGSLNECASAVPAREVTGGNSQVQVAELTHSDCTDDAPVTIYALVNVGHQLTAQAEVELDSGETVDINEAIWRFLMTYRNE
jgi:polyhydroxybutyrate depolymerase